MDRIIYQGKSIKVKVKDIITLIVVLLLLFFCFKSCQVEGQKEAKISNICVFTNENIFDLNQLLQRADLCSEDWFDDLDDYISRLEGQNYYLSKKENKDHQTVYQLQKDLVKKLKALKQKQSKEHIDTLETTFQEYKKNYEDKCIGKIKGE